MYSRQLTLALPPHRETAIRSLLLFVCAVSTLAHSQSSNAAERLWLDVARSSITTTELHSHVSVLANDMFEGREAGSRGGHAAARYIVQRLQAAGLQPGGNAGQFTQAFLQGNQNLLAVLPGTDPLLKHEYLLLGAHYDHVGYGSRQNSYGPWGYIHNGADDNASGVAAVLEVIDALANSGHQPRRSILFAFWDGEEKGLLGSKHWQNYPTMPISSVGLAINIDMVGRLTDGRIEVGGTRSATGVRRLMSNSRLSDEIWLDFNWEYKNNSDHWTFYQAGIPSLYLHTGLHDDYHRPSDDVEKLNIDGIRTVSRYLLEQLSELADTDELPAYRDTATRETPATQRQLEQTLPPLASRLDFQSEFVRSNPASVLVRSVPWGSQASHAGLAVGDRILSADGQTIASESTLPAIALQSEATLAVEVIKGSTGERVSLNLPLVGNPTRLGLSWRTDTAEPHAVYITRVVPHSPAALAGIELHNRLYEINGAPILGASELLDRVRMLLDAGASTLDCMVESRGHLREVRIQLGRPAATPSDATL